MIKPFIQGSDAQQDRELFSFVGPWTTSREISKELGMPIFSEPGDVWFLSVGPSGTLWGFALIHLFQTTKTAHLRYLYVADGNARVQSDLLKEALALAKAHDMESIYTNDREKDGIWSNAGFKKHKKPRSSFYKWEKTLKEPK